MNFVNSLTFDEIGEMDISQNLRSEENICPTKFSVVEVDRSVRPACVTILLSHESKKSCN